MKTIENLHEDLKQLAIDYIKELEKEIKDEESCEGYAGVLDFHERNIEKLKAKIEVLMEVFDIKDEDTKINKTLISV